MAELPQGQWTAIKAVALERDEEENLDNLLWAAVKLGKGAVDKEGTPRLDTAEDLSPKLPWHREGAVRKHNQKALREDGNQDRLIN